MTSVRMLALAGKISKNVSVLEPRGLEGEGESKGGMGNGVRVMDRVLDNVGLGVLDGVRVADRVLVALGVKEEAGDEEGMGGID